MVKKKLPDNLLERLLPVLLVASIGLAFAVGVLWQKVNNLEKGGGSNVAAGQQMGEGAQQPPPVEEGPAEGKLGEEQAKNVPPVSDSDHIQGSRDAKVFLIEYSDYECPFCARFHPTAQQVLDEYGNDLAWVYRHFPLDQIHPNARPAAEASECVAELGGEEAFWKFTDILFEDGTKVNDLEAAAAEAGVSASSFSSCVENRKYEDVVEEHYQGGVAAGVRGTPGNFLVNSNGDAWFIPGAYPYETIQPMIEEALQGS